MSPQSPSTLEKIFIEVKEILEPLVAALAEDPPRGLMDLLADTGIILNGENIAAFLEEFADSTGTSIATLIAEDSSLPARLDALKTVINALKVLDDIENSICTQPIGKRLFNYLLISHLNRNRLGLLGLLQLTGVVWEPPTISELISGVMPDPENIDSLDQYPDIDFSSLATWLNNPAEIFSGIFGWGTQNLQPYKILDTAENLLLAAGLPVLFRSPNPEDAAILGTDPNRDFPDGELRVPLANYEQDGVRGQAGLAIVPLPGDNVDILPGFAFVPYGVGGLSQTIDLGDNWLFSFDASLDTSSSRYGVILRPTGVNVRYLESQPPQTDTGPQQLSAHLAILRELPIEQKSLILGDSSGISLSVGNFGLLLDFEYDTDGADFNIRFPIQGARIQVKPPADDGFLASLLPASGLRADFDVTVGWSSQRGFAFDGSSTLDIDLPVHVSMGGMININRINLGIGFNDNGELIIGGDASASFKLGPFAASVDRIGLEAAISFSESNDGNLGPMNFEMDFKPPNGLALAIDNGIVRGGGYMGFYPAAGRYEGLLVLDIHEISVTAIGLLDTRQSNGQPLPPPGFSLLLIISSDFPAIQLGFGFTLSAVGGMIGIHRTMALEALQSGIRSGATDSIMFPDDPLENIPRIVSDIRTFFPVQRNRFIFGPMATLNWGTPPMITAELGLFLEVPDPVLLALIGQIRVNLPKAQAAIISLNLDVLGNLDFDQKMLAVDASLWDSQIAGFPIEGDMAMRLNWGGKPSFALSIGGFNRDFKPPPNFPELRRIRVPLGLDDNPRLNLEGYMAITSNSVQFGARADFYAAIGPASICGWIYFDAFFTFEPFYFCFDFNMGMSVQVYGETLTAIQFIGAISGPSPFHIRGKAHVSVLFWDICISVNLTLGRRRQVFLPPADPQEIWEQLKSAIETTDNWSADLPSGVIAGVSLREPGAGAPAMVHPMGGLTMRQKVLPLNRRLDKIGESSIPGGDRFDLQTIQVGDNPIQTTNGSVANLQWRYIKDYFAPGQFHFLTDEEKLSRDSFEQMNTGVTIDSNRVVYGEGCGHSTQLQYETVIIDSPWESQRVKDIPDGGQADSTNVLTLWSGLRDKYAIDRSKYASFAVDKDSDPNLRLDIRYGIVSRSDLTTMDMRAEKFRLWFKSNPGFQSLLDAEFLSKSDAYELHNALRTDFPKEMNYYQIVPKYELGREDF
ncbi:MAG: hypothetical protein GY799_05370 [Desulfobulbaceae bacterium]|nr:hypothetical protein [Desulfobulbaceae bacterium]